MYGTVRSTISTKAIVNTSRPVGPSPLRRLTRLELLGTVKDEDEICAKDGGPRERKTLAYENRRIQMRLALSCALLASALLGLSACNKAASPDKVQADVAKAQSDAVEGNAKADEKQKQVEAEAAKERVDAQAKAVDKNVSGLVDSAVTQAEGETKVALAKCEALDGDAQKACKDEANAHMDAVKERAKAAKSG